MAGGKVVSGMAGGKVVSVTGRALTGSKVVVKSKNAEATTTNTERTTKPGEGWRGRRKATRLGEASNSTKSANKDYEDNAQCDNYDDAKKNQEEDFKWDKSGIAPASEPVDQGAHTVHGSTARRKAGRAKIVIGDKTFTCP